MACDFGRRREIVVGSEFLRSEVKARPALEIVRVRSIADGRLALPLARAWHAESRYRHLAFSEKKYVETVLALLRRGERGAGYVAMLGARPLGLMNVAVGEAILSEGGCYATCLAWFVHPHTRETLLGGRVGQRLYVEALCWARAQGASELSIHGTHGTSRYIERLGKNIGQNTIVHIH